ncbi:hypothetical protein I8748_28870 [Nostoc sp. CENA67]|uniref:Uncharacterized protein n=1 Tax=Amazonocrinis nigriterrae CENA67 TaxID=2794033 RepID=A0A8J7I139_9NOST|nr:hypothetical protein [Amazonocrinis nigriterrae]MBH8566124.1 hypothetical protein [Amazonocrinis nigriterrae CENA67]
MAVMEVVASGTIDFVVASPNIEKDNKMALTASTVREIFTHWRASYNQHLQYYAVRSKPKLRKTQFEDSQLLTKLPE